ncbi:hypothetical protein EKD16_12210 [Streptomonospora litoralis]|uniref:Uncharacterized protein n=1 Tax=Streptomonospora litoralis TaxID=2498135 RepID=A0A4P6Q131_9ACTN|nr:hypothetical protein EKD16_12210 [Streptomonospora litoralis]
MAVDGSGPGERVVGVVGGGPCRDLTGPGDDVVGGGRSGDAVAGRVAGLQRQCRRRAFAQSQAGTLVPGELAALGARRAGALGQLRAQPRRVLGRAGDVGTDVHDPAGSLLEGEHRIEGRDAVGLGRRDRQPAADVVECGGADPAHPVVDGVQGRQEQVATAAGDVAALGESQIGGLARAAVPPRLRRAEDGVHGLPLGGLRHSIQEVQVHVPGHLESCKPGHRRCIRATVCFIPTVGNPWSLACSAVPSTGGRGCAQGGADQAAADRSALDRAGAVPAAAARAPYGRPPRMRAGRHACAAAGRITGPPPARRAARSAPGCRVANSAPGHAAGTAWIPAADRAAHGVRATPVQEPLRRPPRAPRPRSASRCSRPPPCTRRCRPPGRWRRWSAAGCRPGRGSGRS